MFMSGTRIMKEVKFTVPGKPMGKQRARTFWNAKLGRMQSITPKETASYEGDIKIFYQNGCGGAVFDRGVPLAIEIAAFFEPVKSESKKRTNLMLAGKIRHIKKPDVDNIAKVVMDALNGLAWHDDSQIVSLSAYKAYAENAELVVTIRSLEKGEDHGETA